MFLFKKTPTAVKEVNGDLALYSLRWCGGDDLGLREGRCERDLVMRATLICATPLFREKEAGAVKSNKVFAGLFFFDPDAPVSNLQSWRYVHASFSDDCNVLFGLPGQSRAPLLNFVSVCQMTDGSVTQLTTTKY
jgi:hypothetical protein